MKKPTKADEKAAVAWLLLAYSLDHTEACACEQCVWARKVLDSDKTAAA